MSASVAPPPMPRDLAPQSNDFNGYKLDPNPLPCRVLPLAAPLSAIGTDPLSSAPSGFHALSQRLKSNQLVLLKSDSTDPEQVGAHAIYYVDHKAIWQLDPPTAVTSSNVSDAGSTAAPGGSHMVYEFESPEDGEGLSLIGVAPCLLLLTRSGGRLTIFEANPLAGKQLTAEGADLPPLVVIFDGTPLCPAPLSAHNATLSTALLSAKRDQLFVVLYEFWQEQYDSAKAASTSEKEAIAFVHEGDALRSAGAAAPTQATEPFSAISSEKHALHKLTALTFSIHHIEALQPTTATAATQSSTSTSADQAPRLELIHSFSSLQNYLLPAEDLPVMHVNDSNWHAPLSCWLQLPPPSIDSASAVPFHWFICSRVPYLNETESVVHELQRRKGDKEAEEKQKKIRDRADETGTERAPIPGIGAAAAATAAAAAATVSAASANLNFTSPDIVPDGHNLKHYAVDQEDDDEDMNEMGLTDPSKYSHNPQPDVYVQLFDPLGSLIAKRPMRLQTFLFAHAVEPILPGAQRSAVIGVKQLEDLLLYEISVAPQIGHGTNTGAAGNVQNIVTAASSSSASSHLGIVLRPLFSFAGLGYVQGGKPHKKFFQTDGSHNFVLLGEYTRLVYVYGKPSRDRSTAPQYLVQLSGDDEDEGQQLYGLQTTVVPMPQTTQTAETSIPGKPLLYVLTRHSCRQFQLPMVELARQ